jgi:hypothetical protein
VHPEVQSNSTSIFVVSIGGPSLFTVFFAHSEADRISNPSVEESVTTKLNEIASSYHWPSLTSKESNSMLLIRNLAFPLVLYSRQVLLIQKIRPEAVGSSSNLMYILTLKLAGSSI